MSRLLPLQPSRRFQFGGSCHRSNEGVLSEVEEIQLITSSRRGPSGHRDQRLPSALSGPQLCLGFPTEKGGSSAVLRVLKRTPTFSGGFLRFLQGTAGDREIVRIRASRGSWRRGRADQTSLPQKEGPHCGGEINRGARGGSSPGPQGHTDCGSGRRGGARRTGSRPLARLSR